MRCKPLKSWQDSQIRVLLVSEVILEWEKNEQKCAFSWQFHKYCTTRLWWVPSQHPERLKGTSRIFFSLIRLVDIPPCVVRLLIWGKQDSMASEEELTSSLSWLPSVASLTHWERETHTWGAAPIKLTCRHVRGGIVLIFSWWERAQPTAGDGITGQVFLPHLE